MQGRDRARQTDGDGDAFWNIKRLVCDPRVQGSTDIEGLGDIEPALAARVERQGLADEGAVDPPTDEAFAQEGAARAALGQQGGFGKFEHHRSPALLVLRHEDPGVSAVRQQPLQPEAVDVVADGGRREDGQAGGLDADRVLIHRPDADDVDDDGGGVVARLLLPGPVDDGLGVRLGRSAAGHQRRQILLRHHAVHAVGGQQQPVVRLERHRPRIEPEVRLDADGAVQDMAEAGLGQHMVLGQPRQDAVAEMPGAAVADMQDRRLAPAHDQGGEGRRRSGHLRIRPALGVEPAVIARQSRHPGRSDALQRALVQIAVDKGPTRQLRRDPPRPGPADPVGDEGQHAVQGLFRRRAQMNCAEILVVLARPQRRGEPRRDLQPAVRIHGRSPCPERDFTS